MIIFGRKHNITKSPLFEGFKDYHSHILPGVDDGVRSLDESLEVLAYYEELKIREVVLTPHVMVDCQSDTALIEATYNKLKEAYHGPIELTLASEYMLDYKFMSHFQSGDIRLLEGSNLLVETSYISAPANLDGLLFEIASSGITPVIAHPERYQYMEQSDYHALKDSGCRFQLNLLSFSMLYGSSVPKTAIKLLESGMYDIMGSDLHSLRRFKIQLKEVNLSTKHIDKLLKIKEQNALKM
ncbi:MAG: CpsB/CapC family capsule biosynthesis tyrosine phosphatase [Rikenellaceae bacterium]